MWTFNNSLPIVFLIPARALGLELQLLEENFPRERVAVRMQAARRDADDGVPCPDGFLAVEHLGFFDHADNRAAHVVFALLVKTGHLRRLAADERAVVFRAGAREALDDVGENVRLEFAGAEIIEKNSGSAPSTAMSLTQWFTRSAPMVSCRVQSAKAILSLVPTPSTDDTSTGSRYFLRSRRRGRQSRRPCRAPRGDASRRAVAAGWI